jgi:Flp pilus assembly protein TadD
MLLAEAGFRAWFAKRQAGLDKELMARLLSGRGEEALAFLQGQRMLRFAGPRYYLQGKLGLIHQQLGQHRAAVEAFRQALEDAPARKSFALAVGLGDSLFVLGEAHEAEQVYRSAIDDEHASPRACANLGRLILRRGGDLEEAETLFRRALDAQRGGGLLRCELVRLLVERGKLEDASFEIELAVEEIGADPTEEETASLESARAALASASPPPSAAPSTE